MAGEVGVVGIAQLERLAARLNTGSARPTLRRKIREALDESSNEVEGRIRSKIMSEDLPVVAHDGGRQLTEAQLRRNANRRVNRASTGVRARIARGVGHTMMSADGKIQTSRLKVATSQLGDKKWLPASIEQGRWRHPVYGDYLNVVTQAGQPFFYGTIRRYKPRIEDILESKVNRVMDEIL